MSITYKTREGDTFESIARSVYGTPDKAGRIRRANPGATAPFAEGVSLIVPSGDVPRVPPRAPSADDAERVTLSVDGRELRQWDGLTINDTLDSFDSADFQSSFDPADGFQRDMFRPFSYQRVEVYLGGERLFRGTQVGVTPNLGGTGNTVASSSYALPGPLEDCTPAVSALPTEFAGLRFDEIAQALAEPFGLSVVTEGDVGPAFEQAACEPDQEIMAFLTGLAKQRGLLMTNDGDGRLVIREGDRPEGPVATLEEGRAPVLSVKPQFQAQRYFSHVTGIEAVLVGDIGPSFTVKNPRLRGVFRPSTFIARDIEESGIQRATEARVGRMFGDAFGLSVRVSGLRDPQGQRWRSNTTVNLVAPSAMIYREYEFLIRAVTLGADAAGGRTADLTLTIPRAFGRAIPERLPWDD